MSISPDDPRLTTYALGELSELKAEEITEIEDGIANDPLVAAEIDALQASAQFMQASFAAQAATHLPQEKRSELIKRSTSNTVPWMAIVGTLAAAGIVVGLLLPSISSASMSSNHARDEALKQYDYTGSLGSEPPMRISALVDEDYSTPIIQSDNYNSIQESGFKSLRIKGNDFSTFSIDVDTASYSDMRSHLTQYNRLPQANAIRIEGMINYFDYQYAGPSADSAHPFRYHVESAVCPWNKQNRLMRIGVQAKRIAKADRPPTNLVFLIDASGSMGSHNKMPLLKNAFKMLVKQLDERDNVAIVAYAGASGLVLPITNGTENHKILNALDQLRSGGSTNGAGGIQQAYAVAQQMFNKDAENRVILATDGDFNVGISDQDSLIALIKEKAQHGIFLNIHGYGMGNRKDGTMELMSNNGNGTYAYIDTNREAQKVMVDDITGSLVTVAKDVKIQCVFNPQHVAAWRLIGYENRILAKEDFKDNKKDAGEIGAGHNVTALYEIVPRGVQVPEPDVDPNPFIDNGEAPQPQQVDPDKPIIPAWLQLRLRYKQPQGAVSTPLVEDVIVNEKSFDSASEDFRWAASVASFGMLLKKSPHAGSNNWDETIAMAKQSRGADEKGLRAECIRLMEMARNMQ